MANCLEIQTADAIVAAINAATWTETFRAERTYADLDHPLEDLDVLKVEVALPEAWESYELDNRNSDDVKLTLEIAIRKRFGLERQNQASGTILREEIDRLVNLTIEMARSFATDAPGSVQASWVSTTLAQLYDRVTLREFHQFTSLIELEFDIDRTLPT